MSKKRIKTMNKKKGRQITVVALINQGLKSKFNAIMRHYLNEQVWFWT